MLSTILVVMHLLLAIGLVAVILLQRNEGGDLLGAGGGMSSFLSGRGRANLLTRATAVLATMFIVTSLALATLAPRHGTAPSILDEGPAIPEKVPAPAPQAAPTVPATPAPPVAR